MKKTISLGKKPEIKTHRIRIQIQSANPNKFKNIQINDYENLIDIQELYNYLFANVNKFVSRKEDKK
jgi:hypothetical protein